MRLLNKLLIVCCTSTCILIASAQDGKKIQPDFTDTVPDDKSKCDSLGDAYLQAGDTSMALYYYEKYLEAYPNEEQTKTAVQKYRRLYTHRNRAFYLNEY